MSSVYPLQTGVVQRCVKLAKYCFLLEFCEERGYGFAAAADDDDDAADAADVDIDDNAVSGWCGRYFLSYV